jgi:hypothetical protein
MITAEEIEERKIGRGSPVGCLIVHEKETDRVFYQNVHTNEEIETSFTGIQVFIARNLPLDDPDHLDWDHDNSVIQSKHDFYRAKGK